MNADGVLESLGAIEVWLLLLGGGEMGVAGRQRLRVGL